MNYKVGDIIDEFKLVSLCGQGSYGTVFIAENQLTTDRIALKIIYKHGNKPERELKGLRQYQIISENTNLLQIYKVKDSEDYFYYTMDAADNLDPNGEYVPDTLGNRLKNSRMEPAAVRKMYEDLLDNLQVLHGKGLFHRDIKPDNILFINNMACLGDIGLVSNSATTTLRGTPGFMPTEVLAGLRSYEAADDYYALGKIIYCALTGLGVNSYPAYPSSCTLTDSGDLIKLYNKFCSPNKTPYVNSNIWQRYSKLTVCAVVLLIAAIFVRFYGKSLIEPEQSGEKLPIRWAVNVAEKPLDKLQSPAKTVDPQLLVRRQKSYEQLQTLLQIYVPGKNMMQLYPQLQKTYDETVQSKRSKNIPLNSEEELLAAYIDNESTLADLIDNIRNSIEQQGSFSDKDAAKLTKLQHNRRDFEEKLIKNHQK